jgi:diguanylate cyclase (GGDEF)-like protein
MIAVLYLLLCWWLGRQYDQLTYSAYKDPLTGMYNRRLVRRLFPKLQHLTDRRGGKLALFLIDVDNFKLINDTYGHLTGDQVLVHVGRKLQESVRSSDYVIRWGGDEFLVIVPFTNDSVMREIQERLVQNVTSNPPESAPVAISAGYAVYPDEGSQFTELLSVADHKMYTSKLQPLAQI